MAWIRTVRPSEATGLLREIYDRAAHRAGKVFQILRVHSLRPEALDATMNLYIEVMQSPRSALSRRQREMIATAVSSFNDCFY